MAVLCILMLELDSRAQTFKTACRHLNEVVRFLDVLEWAKASLESLGLDARP